MKLDDITEGWSEKYKRSIDCDNPKGFSQRAHCQGRKKTNEAPYVKGSYKRFDPTRFDEPGKYSDPEYKKGKSGERNPNMSMQFQLKKSITLNGTYDVFFKNGETVKVNQETAIRVLTKLDKINKPNDKLKAAEYIGQSYENLQKFIKNDEKFIDEDINNLPDWETIVAIAAAAKMTPMAIKALWSTAKGAYKIKKFADKMGIKLADNLVGESNPFTDARMNAIKAGKKHFTVKGKKYPVTGDTRDEEEAIANEAEQQELPIDMNRIFTKIQQLESSGVITPQEADDMRRAAQALAAGRKTILPDRILQLLTMVA